MCKSGRVCRAARRARLTDTHSYAHVCRRKLMEEVAVQTAQYQLLQSKNARFVKAAKDYKLRC